MEDKFMVQKQLLLITDGGFGDDKVRRRQIVNKLRFSVTFGSVISEIKRGKSTRCC